MPQSFQSSSKSGNLSELTCLKAGNWFIVLVPLCCEERRSCGRTPRPRPAFSNTWSNISESGIHGSKGQANPACSCEGWLLGLREDRGEFLHRTRDMRAGGSDKKDFPLCSRTVSKIEGYFSRHVSSSLGQNTHWCKASRLQKSYPGLNLSSVCLRQGRNSSFEESKLEIYSLLSISSSPVVPFSLP